MMKLLQLLSENINDWVQSALEAKDTYVEAGRGSSDGLCSLLGAYKYKEYDKWAARISALKNPAIAVDNIRISIDQRSIPPELLIRPTPPDLNFHDVDEFEGEVDEDVSVIIMKDGIFIGEWLIGDIKYKIDWWPPEVTQKLMAAINQVIHEIKVRL